MVIKVVGDQKEKLRIKSVAVKENCELGYNKIFSVNAKIIWILFLFQATAMFTFAEVPSGAMALSITTISLVTLNA